ncbi:MAG: hypothetical protein HY958_04065, partial [Bacteroidia bacterium]|nr:hypothetical protein [Bacteroidia bacterium]
MKKISNNLSGKALISLIAVLGFIFFSNCKVTAADYYWVNGPGNWSAFATHWATASGGAVFHTSVPGASDNVFFDANSFTLPLIGQAVTVDVMATCNNMNWTGVLNNPDFAGNNSLEIYGSVIFVPGMTASYNGMLTFKANGPGNIIDFSTVVLNINNFQFDGTGEWTLNSDIDCSALGFSMFTVLQGTLNTNNKTISVGQFQSWPMGARVINLGSSTINCKQNFQLMDPSTLDFNAGISTINIGQTFFNVQGFTFYDVNFVPQWPGEVNFMGANNFHTLGFNDPNVYGVVFTSNELVQLYDINFGATCSFRKNVRANMAGEAAIIKKISGLVKEDYLNIRDITVIGGATFITDNGVNLGNVTNWTINSSLPNTLYWVGGTGNWSDPDHWSTSSGGLYPSGNTCVPSDVDNVFFDANSFSAAGQTVTINTYASCNNMNWTGVTNNPTLANSWPSELNIFGSLTLDPGMTYNFTSSVYFRSANPGNTITTAGKSLNSSVYFEGTGGWTLQDNFAGSWVYHNKGNLNTNNKNVTISSYSSGSNATRQISLGSSTVTCSWGWSIYDNTNMTLNCGTSLISVNGSFSGGSFTYNNVTLDGTGTSYVYDSNIFNNLTHNGGSYLYFEAGSTQTFNSFTTAGTCSGLVNIRSNTTGTTATLSKAAGIVTVNYVSLKDIDAVGGATFNANNSIDDGNVTGWNFVALPSTNYYWIGGAGNWNDPLHWSLASGGAANPGGCIPTQADNVFFNNQSGLNNQTVTVNVTAYCNNMDWTGISPNGRLAGSEYIYVYGSYTLAANMIMSHTGNMFFSSAAVGNTINTAGKSILGNVYFSGAGSWTLQGNFTVSNSKSIYFNKGTLTTNNFNITAPYFYGQTADIKQLNLGSSTVTVNYWSISAGSNLTIVPGTSTINVSSSSGFSGGNCNYNNVNCNYNGGFYVYGSNSFNTLNIPNCTSLYFQGGETTTFTTLTFPNGTDCNNYFNIGSYTAGQVAHFSKPAGIFNKNWLRISDLTASGGATFNALSSQGIGDVTGWNIFSPAGVDLYWIGNTGNWNDPNHWSLTSGGAPYGCIPTTNDDVFFDANSFSLAGQIVTVNVPSSCKNMDWTGVTNNPEIAGWSPLSINGSLTFVPAMIMSYGGTLNFISSAPGNTVFTAGLLVNGMSFNGDYSLLDNINMNWGTVTFNNGILNTNNHDIISNGSFVSNSTNPRILNFGSSNLEFNSWQISDNTNLVINAGTSEILLTNNPWEFRGGDMIYNNVTIEPGMFGGWTTIYGSNTFNRLKIETGAEIHFESGSTQTTSNLEAVGDPGNNIILHASIDGNSASLNQTAQEFCGDYLKIQDIDVSGTTFYAGNNSTDQGNNTGWTWSGVTAIDQYPAGMCEDVLGGGTVAGINLTLLEDAIDGGNPYTHTWYQDAGLTIFIADPTSVTVSDGQIFYDAVNNGICINVAEVTFTVFPLPVASFLVTDASCFGFSDGTVDLTVITGLSPFDYQWSTGAVTEDISGLPAGWYKVTITDTNGCINIDSAQVDEPALVEILSVTNGWRCDAGNVTLSATASAGTINWYDVPTGGISLGTGTVFTTPVISATTNYYVDATFNGCTSPSRTQVTATVYTTPSITAVTPGSRCDAGTVALGATASAGTINWYDVATGGASLGTGTAFTTPSISATTNYYVDATANGCTTASRATVTATVYTTPSITAVTPGSRCDAGTVALGATASAGTINWYNVATGGASLGTGSSFTTPSISATTNYYVDATANGCTTASRTVVTATVYTTPSITAVTPGSRCDAGTVSLGATVSAGTINWYNVSTGGSSLGTGITFTTPSISATTNYYVDATANGCTTASRTVVTATVYTTPSITAVTPGSRCDAGTVALGATASAGTINWYDVATGGASLGTGSSFTTPSISTTTNYYVDATVNGCTTASRTVVTATVYTLPVVIANTTSDTVCTGIQVTLTGSGALSYTWNNGVTNGMAFAPAATATYTVTGTDVNGCTDTDQIIIVVNSLPTVVANATNNTICNGTSITLTGSGTLSYAWDNGVTNGVAFAPAATTTYTVTGTDMNGCTDTDQITITVNALPTVVAIATNDTICTGTSITLTGSGALSYVWNNGVNNGVPFVPVATTTYMVTGTDANGCQNVDDVTIVVNPVPVASVLSYTQPTICGATDGSVTVTDNVSYTYLWNTVPAQTTSTASNLGAGNYIVTVSLGSCIIQLNQSISDPAAPTITLTSSDADGTVCAGESVEFTADGIIAGNYIFFVNGVANDTVTYPANTFILNNITSAVSVFVEGIEGTCTGVSDAITITTFPIPVVSANGNATICEGFTHNILLNLVGTQPWTLLISDGASTDTIHNVNNSSYSYPVSPANTTTYSISGIDANGCSDIDQVIITVNPLPVISINASSTSVCSGGEVTLTASGADTYSWSGGIINGTPFTPVASATYNVTGTDVNGCVNTSDIEITVNEIYTISNSAVICDGDSLFAGGLWQYSSGTFTDSLTTIFGCDSVITTVLIVNSAFVISSVVEICEGDSILLGGSWQTEAGDYSDVLQSVYGCDSTVVTNLIVNPVFVISSV